MLELLKLKVSTYKKLLSLAFDEPVTVGKSVTKLIIAVLEN